MHTSTIDTNEELASQVSKARAAADQTTQELETRAAHSQDESARHWSEMRREWRDHIARIQTRIDAEKDKIDVSRTQHRAGLAERDAIEAVNFAYLATEWAEWAVLDAERVRRDADELAGIRV